MCVKLKNNLIDTQNKVYFIQEYIYYMKNAVYQKHKYTFIWEIKKKGNKYLWWKSLELYS